MNKRIAPTEHSTENRRFVQRHGQMGTTTYTSWRGMIRRCTSEKDSFFASYGGRGILVCDRWLYSFQNFLDDMGHRPKGRTLGRIDNNAGYSLSNCSWETRKQQQINRASVRLLQHSGKCLCIADWARATGLGPSVIRRRLDRGWSVEDTLTRPTSAYTTEARRAARLGAGQ